MACVALTSLIVTMELEFLQPIPRVPLDDEASISMESLFEKLLFLKVLVQQKSGGGSVIRDLEVKIRDFALEAEDGIEIQLSNFLLAKNGEDQQKACQKFHQILQEAAENAAELLEIIKEADDEEEVVNKRERSLIPWLKHASEPGNNVISFRRHSPMLEEEGRMVGRHLDHMLVVDQLVPNEREEHRAKVITIVVGMTGIGKTTLARNVYNDPKVTSHFDVRCWVTMSGEYNKTQMLHHLLWTLAEADDDEIKEGSIPKEGLAAAEQVYKCLKGGMIMITPLTISTG
ncbi:putative disease resistance protein At1g59780 [Ipomoea triloba]|uniref:putative disease resistance protein At1g59780 n=1 Tax=Ipomoea triloba TaxID=35885 RepID=UPI00125DAE02|nr:putative disease resistance protein At1g59780 [Ipomoea triloba]